MHVVFLSVMRVYHFSYQHQELFVKLPFASMPCFLFFPYRLSHVTLNSTTPPNLFLALSFQTYINAFTFFIRYIPSNLLLAIQEMDENHLPKFSFQNREGIAQVRNACAFSTQT